VIALLSLVVYIVLFFHIGEYLVKKIKGQPVQNTPPTNIEPVTYREYTQEEMTKIEKLMLKQKSRSQCNRERSLW